MVDRRTVGREPLTGDIGHMASFQIPHAEIARLLPDEPDPAAVLLRLGHA